MGHTVQLEWYEILQAAMSGVMKRIEAMRSGKDDDYGWGGNHQQDTWTREIEGAAAEVAYAKFRNQYWSGTVNTFRQADVGSKVQVRGCPFKGKNLLIRPRDSDTDVFVLVVGRCPTFTIEGWILGSEAKRPELQQFPNGGSPVYLLEPSRLHQFCATCKRPSCQGHEIADPSKSGAASA